MIISARGFEHRTKASTTSRIVGWNRITSLRAVGFVFFGDASSMSSPFVESALLQLGLFFIPRPPPEPLYTFLANFAPLAVSSFF
jgi:hypothetical protein